LIEHRTHRQEVVALSVDLARDAPSTINFSTIKFVVKKFMVYEFMVDEFMVEKSGVLISYNPYKELFGGVCAMTRDQFYEVNGFSNMYWGWGGEDDDMYHRLRQKNLSISRYPLNIARYHSIYISTVSS
jgi:predicted glycosyltransferase involved in capsule biosynthesis